MATREFEFITGPETSTLPTTGTPSSGTDLVSLDYIRKIVGTRAAPTSITAGGGISISDLAVNEIAYIQGSGGAVDITANPQIAAPTDSVLLEGMWLTLIGRSDTNTVKLDNGNGLSLNGSITLGADDVLNLWWDGTAWVEKSRN